MGDSGLYLLPIKYFRTIYVFGCASYSSLDTVINLRVGN